MSDIQDLIYKTTMDCLERGAEQEQERIIKLLDDLAFHINSVEHNPAEAEGAYRALALIKEETK